MLLEEFPGRLQNVWQVQLTGTGRMLFTLAGLRLEKGITTTTRYTNAQLDDYHTALRRDFPWRPPLRLTLRARFSHGADQLRGTAGFGFWNDPLVMSGGRHPSLPQAAWFFFNSADSRLQLALETPGHGWRAATIDGWRWPFLLLTPVAPVGLLLVRWPWLYRRLWPIAQWAMGVSEASLPVDMTAWHTYQLLWATTSVRFLIDEQVVLHTLYAPGGPLGLVLWIDNQGLIVTPWNQPRHILTACSQEQWVELAWVKIET
jgi:hypothetical protein